MAFELVKLGYDYTALEPHIDASTMEIHHTKHHAGYTNNLNAAIAGTALEGKTIEEILWEFPVILLLSGTMEVVLQPQFVLGSDCSGRFTKTRRSTCSVQLTTHLVHCKIFRRLLSKLR
jgi:hypothetical protein